jgi:hypothetical protein
MRELDDDRAGCDRPGSRARTALIRATAIAAVLGMLQVPAAAIEVRGQVDDMQLRTENASIREVLTALSSHFRVTFKLAPNVDRVVGGVYSGSLRQVLARILDGNDYVVTVTDNGMRIIVLGPSRTATTGQAIATAPAAPSGPASGPAVQRPPTPTVAVAPPILPASSLPPPLASYLPTN